MEHVEINVSNLETGKEFYEQLFGWDIHVMPEFNYAMINPGVTPNAGLAIGAANLPNTVALYFTVEDMEATLEKIVSAGGTIRKDKTLIHENIGYISEFIDVSGNYLGLWSKD
jgi:predicted enzyme related to lactoylglutathione lyase